MKNLFKLLMSALVAAIMISVLSVICFAVPAYHQDSAAGGCKSHPNKLVTLDDIPIRTASSGAKRLQKVNTKKDIPLVVIVIGFNNVSYNDSFNWGETIFQGEKSLSKYYSDMSFGQFTFVPVSETSAYGTGNNTNKFDKANDGVIHIKLDSDHDNWSLQPGALMWNQQVNLIKALINAINSADAYIDFSQYDANKNGVIENNEMALGFIVAGYEAAMQETYNSFSFWSHAWNISEAISELSLKLKAPTVDKVRVDSYIGISEKLEKGVQEPICVLAHELGHYLGLPDLYDTAYSMGMPWSSYDVSYLSVMCSGVWCEDDDTGSYMPSSMDAWSRYELGWIKPVKAIANGTFTLTSQNYSDTTEKIQTVLIPTQTSNEYYIVENRQFEGWDKSLGKYYTSENGGVVIWHIDKNVYNAYADYNMVNNTDHRPSVMPLYPEQTDSKMTFIGSGSVIYNPFFDKTVWANDFASSLGAKLNLPLYGKGSNANKRNARSLSGIGIEFTEDSCANMNIFVDIDSHIHSVVHLNSAPSCTSKGYNECYFCSYCRKYFKDSDCKTQISSQQAIIPAIGHNYKFSETVKPMADGDGYDLYVCEHCGDEKPENFKKLVGWGQDSEGIWYYAKSDGKFLTGWQKIKGNWYFFNKSGQMQTGWVKDAGKWYYMASSGKMKTGWVKVSGKWYYLNTKGVMLTGWQKLDGKWYYLNTKGVMLTGWQKIDSKWYYFNPSGVMQTENLTYKGKVYRFKSSGECINP